MNEMYDRVDANGVVIGRGVRTVILEPSLAKQSMKDECDINRIMKKFERTGLVTHLAKREAYFADVSAVPDFAKAVEVISDAENMFMTLPAKLRARFENDPSQYVAFCLDEKNQDEMVELGLLNKPKPKPAPVEVIVSNPVPPVDKGGKP